MFLTFVTVASVLFTPTLARVLGRHTSPGGISEFRNQDVPKNVAHGYPVYVYPWYPSVYGADGYGAPAARSAGDSYKSPLFIRPPVPQYPHGNANHRSADGMVAVHHFGSDHEN